ncbi:MAG: hypothetical protein HG446_001290 [Flavobacteriaceae bacterium]|nr:hypothetical protein [Flavobacteriaceae bacterium]
MKNKIYFWMIGLVMTLVSCNVTADITLHKDKTQSIVMDIDGKEAAKIFKDENKKDKKDKDDLPKEWTSLYEMNLKKDKKERITAPDTIAVMKKIYVKGSYDKDDLTDISFKTDKLTNKELSIMFNKKEEKSLPILDLFSKNEWDGKTLKINTSVLNDILIKKNQGKESDLYWMMFTKDYRVTFHFDSEIKKIEGKHDLVRKVNNNTVEIKFSSDDILQKDDKFKNDDSFITITTK